MISSIQERAAALKLPDYNAGFSYMISRAMPSGAFLRGIFALP
jgi:hypothetical protein